MKIALTVFIMIICFAVDAQVVINNNGNEGHGSAILDLQSSSKGFLPSRLSAVEIKAIVDPAEGLSVYNLDTHKPIFYNGTAWMYFDGSPMLFIGEYAYGGVIFYLDCNGGGLVCDINDATSDGLGCSDIFVGDTDVAIYTGYENTAALSLCSEEGTAIYYCKNLSLNGYTDWFLPSRDELNEMYIHRETINPTAIANGGSSFSNIDYYWSSSEAGQYIVYVQDFGSGIQDFNLKEEPYNKLRAVRAFP